MLQDMTEQEPSAEIAEQNDELPHLTCEKTTDS